MGSRQSGTRQSIELNAKPAACSQAETKAHNRHNSRRTLMRVCLQSIIKRSELTHAKGESINGYEKGERQTCRSYSRKCANIDKPGRLRTRSSFLAVCDGRA